MKNIHAKILVTSVLCGAISPINTDAYDSKIITTTNNEDILGITRDTRLKGFGGSGADSLDSVTATSDGGSIVVGKSNSQNITLNTGNDNAVIMKLNALGEIEWQKIFDGNDNDGFTSVVQLPNGDYIAGGYSNSTDLDFENKGSGDAILVKYSNSGEKIWTKSIGGSQLDTISSIAVTSDGNIVVTGNHESSDNGFSSGGMKDSFIAKYNSTTGNQEWIQYLTGAGDDIYCSVVELMDGSIIAVGYSYSYDLFIPGITTTEGIIVKYDSDGNRIWGKKIGGNQEDYLYSLIKTSDGGFIAVGESNTATAGLPVEPKGDNDAIIVKYNKNGELEWINSFGGSGREGFLSVIETTDNKFMAVGRSSSTDAGFENKGHNDAIIVQFDKNGNQEWSTSFGGSYNEYFNSVARTIDGGFVAVGYTHSGDIGFTHNGDSDGMIANNNPIIDVVNDSLKSPESITDISSISDLIDKVNELPSSNIKDSFQTETLDLLIAKVESDRTVENIALARNIINNLEESILKDTYQDKLNSIIYINGITFDKKSATANVDIYIKSENMLSLTLDTNSITFEDFSGVEDIEKNGAVNLSVNSSLPYELNAYLPTEIQNSDKSKTMDKKILNIKEGSELDYKTFDNVNQKLTLKDNNIAGNNKSHAIDLKLKGGLAYEADVYKATIKFEVNQK